MTFESTDLGRVMAKYCVAVKTMETMGAKLTSKTTMAGYFLMCVAFQMHHRGAFVHVVSES